MITDMDREKHAYAALRLLQAGCREASERELYLANGRELFMRVQAPNGRVLMEIDLPVGTTASEQLSAIEQTMAMVESRWPEEVARCKAKAAG